MKKIFSFLLLGLLLSVGNVWADQVTIWSENWSGTTASQTPATCTITGYSDITYAYDNGGGTTQTYGKSSFTSPELLIAKNNGKFTVTIPASRLTNLNSTLNLQFDSNKNLTLTITNGTAGSNTGSNNTYKYAVTVTNNTQALVIEFKNALSSNARFSNVTLVGTEADMSKVETPVIDGADFLESTEVSISCGTEGAAIQYSTDNGENWNSYTVPFAIYATTTIKAKATKGGLTDSDIASQTFTKVAVLTVAQARAAIDAGGDLTNKYVSGIISQVDSYNSTYHSITYWISDDGTTTNQLQVYSGKGLNGADFSAKSDLQVNDEVIVTGTLKKYNSTYEFDLNNQLVSFNRPAAAPIINAENVELAYNATSGEIAYTISNPTEATLTAASATDWISNINVAADKVTFTTTVNEGDIDREGFITLSYTGAADKVITVTQAHFVIDYATLPFAFNGGRDAIASIVGLTQTGLGTDYTSSPKLKFDGTGDNLILKINEAPETLTFDIKGNGFSGGTFKVQTSADGVNYEDLETYDALGDKQSEEFNLNLTVRYIKWIYTSKSDGNVALGNIAVSKLSTDPEILLSETSINVLSNGTLGENITVTFKNITEVTEQTTDIVFFEADGVTAIAAQAEPDWVIVDLDLPNNHLGYVVDPNAGAARYAYLRVYALDDEANDVYSELITISQDAYVPAANYVIVTDAADIVPGAHYIIANGTNGDIQIMGEQRSNNRGVQNVTAVDGVIDIPAGAETHEFVICKDGDLFAIYEAEVGYLYAASSGSNYLKSQATNDVNGRWEITIDGEDSVASIIATESTNRNVMRYNSTSNIFSCYGSASQSDVYLYRKTGESFTTETVTVSDVGYATLYYGTENLIVPEGVVARTYKVEGGALVETETYEAGEVVPKKIAVVLEGAEGIYDFIVTPVPGMGPAATNLKGSDVATTTTGGTYYYGLSLNSASEANSVGFYWMAAGGVAFTNGAHKAYLAVDELPASAPERILFHDNSATNIQNVEGNEKAVKFIENGQLYILKNGVVYDAMGKTVR